MQTRLALPWVWMVAFGSIGCSSSSDQAGADPGWDAGLQEDGAWDATHQDSTDQDVGQDQSSADSNVGDAGMDQTVDALMDVPSEVSDGSLAEVSTDAGPPQGYAVSQGGTGADVGNSVAVDGEGNAYVAGYFNQTVELGSTTLQSQGGNDVFVAKYSPSGEVVWAKSAGGSGDDQALGIAVASDGTVTITGAFQGSAAFGSSSLVSEGQFDIFVARYDSSGELAWAKSAGSIEDDVGTGVAVSQGGDVWVTGNFRGTCTFGSEQAVSLGKVDAFVARYDSQGELVWVRSGGSPAWDGGNAVAVDADNSAFVVGFCEDNATFGAEHLTGIAGQVEDVLVVKYSAQGQVLWARSYGGAEQDEGIGVGVDSAGGIRVTGFIQGTAPFGSDVLVSQGLDDVFVAAISAAGDLQWTWSGGGSGTDDAIALGMDSDGNALIAGYFEGSVALGATSLSSNGASDAFVTVLSPNGLPLWAKSGGGSGDDFGYGVAAGGEGTVVSTGSFQGSARFDTTQLTSHGADDVFVWRATAP